MSRPEQSEALRPFRPRRGRWVAIGSALVLFLLFVLIAVVAENWGTPDRLMTVLGGAGLAAFLWRYAAIRAVPDRQGMTVRNLFTTQRVEWNEVRGVVFSPGDPWVRLQRTHGQEDLAVMAIQAADGDASRAEASRLAGIVEALRR
ncbi:PH domain-containing protein [Kytococcus sedentarius]|uniref:PH domain-containing protein n=1 Tax=Kytococcus sedentarius TaxID=1276 RepID=UPI0035BBB820